MIRSRLVNKVVFVTGGSGFIGSNLIERLLREKAKVRVLLRKGSDRQMFINLGCDVVIGDLTDLESVKRGVKGANMVFNLAAGLPHHKLSADIYDRVNKGGVENILKACNRYNTERLIHVSTVGVYGSTDSVSVNELSPYKLTDAYSRSKAAAEELIRVYITKYHLPVVVIRPTIGFGPGDTRPGFLDLFRLINRGIFIPIGNQNNYFHTVYIGNLIDGLILAAVTKEAVGEDFIIGDAVCPTMGDVVNAIAQSEHKKLTDFYIPLFIARFIAYACDFIQKLGIKAPLTSARLKFITDIRKFDISKAKKILGYNPKISLEEGMRITHAWYIQNGYL